MRIRFDLQVQCHDPFADARLALLPQEGTKKPCALVIEELKEAIDSELAQFCGGKVCEDIEKIMKAVDRMSHRKPPDDIPHFLEKEFLHKALGKMENFLAVEQAAAPGIEEKIITGRAAMSILWGNFVCKRKENCHTLRDTQPMIMFNWMLDGEQQAIVDAATKEGLRHSLSSTGMATQDDFLPLVAVDDEAAAAPKAKRQKKSKAVEDVDKEIDDLLK